jgi:hypothetical protein
MIELGKYNLLKAERVIPNGAILSDRARNEVLLPKKFIPSDLRLKDEIKVFIYKDSEERITATTQTPKICLGEFALLQVKDSTSVGAFLDWGLDKDLLVPFKEQPVNMLKNHWYVVYLFLDKKTDRLVASGRLNRFLEKENIDLIKGQEVDLFVTDHSQQGWNVIINNKYRGLIFESDLYQKLEAGDKTTGYIKNIRPDKKIDVVLSKPGYEGIEPGAKKILEILKRNKGYLEVNDDSSPEEIKALFAMSKKTFKKSIGSLYKQKIIQIGEKGIKLL